MSAPTVIRLVGGPLLTLATIGVLVLLPAGGIEILNPAAILLLSITVAAFLGGWVPAVVSAAIAVVYQLVFFSAPGTLFQYEERNAARVAVQLIAMPANALLTAYLREGLVRSQNALREANARLERQAETDTLTGLLSRRGFGPRADAALAAARGGGRPVALVYFDVDGLRETNDRGGHGAGDQLLKLVARDLESSIAVTDLAARMGGDEFAALLPENDRAAALAVAERVRERLRGSIAELPVKTSADVDYGIAAAPDDGQTLADLLRVAEGQMLERKATRPAVSGAS